MDYRKLHWHSDWMYSEVFGDVDEEDDIAVGLYSPSDFPEISMYIDLEKNKILEVWLNAED